MIKTDTSHSRRGAIDGPPLPRAEARMSLRYFVIAVILVLAWFEFISQFDAGLIEK